MESLQSEREEWLRQIEAAAGLDALEQIRVAALGRNGQVTGLLEGAGQPSARGAQIARRRGQPPEGRDRGRARRGERSPRARGARPAPGARAHRRHLAGEGRKRRAHPSDQPDHRRADRDLRRDGLHRRRGPAYRGRFLQFHRAQHSARASRAPGAGHLLPDGAGRQPPPKPARCCAPIPRRCRSAPCRRKSRRSASSCPAAPSAAITTPRIRRCSIRSKAWSSTAHPYGASQRLPHRILPRLLRYRRSAGALPAELLPLHRALGRGRYRLLARRRRAEDRRRRRLARDPRLAAWCIRRCSPIAASIRPSIRASPSAWGSSASPC